MTAFITLQHPVDGSEFDSESPLFVECMGEFFDVARKFDRECGRGPFSLSITRPAGGTWVASYGGVRCSGPDVWSAIVELFKTLKTEVE